MKWDPSRTTLLRKSFESDMTARFRSFKKALVELVTKAPGLTTNEGDDESEDDDGEADEPERPAFEFKTDDKKLEAFNKWVKQSIKSKILTTDSKTKAPWTGKYVQSAYKKGIVRGYVDARGKKLMSGPSDFFEGSKAEFMRSAFSQPERMSKVRLLATRSFEDLKNVTSQMATDMNRIMARGILDGEDPRKLAKKMSDEVDGITRSRAVLICRTEVVHAHAEGQLDSFEDLGVDELGVEVEWSTAGDDRVCEDCEDMDGKTFTVDEARGKIPLHPNCRCAWVPAEVKGPTKKQLARA